MNRLYLNLILVSFIVSIISATIPANAQWQHLTGLQGEPAYWIRGTSTDLYTVTANGVLGSSNNGLQWNIIPDLYQTNTVENVSASGDTIVAFAFPQSYLSTDNGLTWNTINDPPASAQINSLIVEDGILLAATAGDYIYRSTDLGVNWNQITQNLGSAFIYGFASEGSTVLAATDDGIYRSTDIGSTYTQVSLPATTVNRLYLSGNYAMAYSSVMGVFKSSDNGVNWQAFEPMIPYVEIRDFCLDGNKIFAAAVDNLIVSDTGAQTWSTVNFNQDVNFCFSIYKKGTSIYAGTNRGVFASANQGNIWTEMNVGITPILTEAMTMLNDTLFVGSNIYGVSNYTSSGWAFSGLGLRNTLDLITRGTDLYTASDFGIYKSTDSGNSWTLINGTPGNPFITFCPRVDVADSLVIGAALNNGILRSGDFGVTWSFENTGFNNASVSCVAISGSNIVAGTYADGIFVSTDAGFTWTPAGAAGEYIVDLTTIGNNVIAASYALSGNFISTDNGATWGQGTADMFEDVSTSGNIVLGSATGFIMLSLDSGQTFQYLTPAPVGTQITGSVASQSDVYVGTNLDGVWKITLSEILSVEENKNAIFAIMYPNAFRSESFIILDDKFLADEPEFIVTDISGKTIQRNFLTQSRTIFNGEHLNSGLYFYTVKIKSGESTSGKFIVY